MTLLHAFKGHHFDSASVAFSPDGGTLASLGTREGLRFWRLDSGREAGHIADPESERYLKLSPDGKRLLMQRRRGIRVLVAE
jgi:WD40 repeat protein